jgi:tetratricopeptide (TPR) repeat protein
MNRWSVVLLLFGSTLTFAQASDPALAEGLRLLEEGRTTLEERSLAQAKGYFTQLTRKSGNNSIYFYQLARVDSYLAESYASHDDKKNAERSLDEAIAATQQSISLNDNSADAHSLLAGLYGRKISFGGFMAGARYGPKIDAENKKAVALDPSNPRVYASLGGEYLHAPKMFGGDVDKAIESFRKATQFDAANDENFVWLALAYRKKGDTANADKALQEALRINPRSAFAKSVAAGK